jgi:serine/threonine protein kinase
MITTLTHVLTSQIYDQEECTFQNFDYKTTDGNFVFRKMIRYQNEIDVIRILKVNPHSNIVSFYDITNKYVDMELLDIDYVKKISELENKEIEIIRAQMSKVKDHLQSLGISYIDWALHNIGFCHQTKQYKLFDFDGSGIFDKENNFRWINYPEPFNIHRYCIYDKIMHPIDMDNNGFNNYSGFGIKDKVKDR